ncbi:hypothetical protein BJX76DRAFT_361474 [Aspergillus varians]
MIVCPQVQFLDAAVKGGFREAAESRVDLPEDEPRTIAMVFSWCYSREYNGTGCGLEDIPFASVNNAVNPHDYFDVYMAADKLGIPDFKQYAQQKLVELAHTHYETALFPGIVERIWCESPPHEKELRNNISQAVARHYDTFRAQQGGAGEKALKNHPNLAHMCLTNRFLVFAGKFTASTIVGSLR